MARTYWYVTHAALDDNERAQKYGVIFMASPRNVQFHQFDRPLSKLMVSSLTGAIPLRLAAAHVLRPPTFFSIIFGIIKLFMPKRMVQRIQIHTGTFEETLQKLENQYGITKDMVPEDAGGTLVLDHEGWLESRRKAGK